MTLAAKAHIQKRDFIEKLLALGDSGPLAMLASQSDGAPHLRMADAHYLIGMTGLNELVQVRKGPSAARVRRGPGLRSRSDRPDQRTSRQTL